MSDKLETMSDLPHSCPLCGAATTAEINVAEAAERMRERCAVEAESWQFPGAKDSGVPLEIAAAIRALEVKE